ncbi:MAG: phosphotransferase [Thermoplasmata archaeon]|nr:phosphotransferase [Thermoplasmata archaeon]
MGDPLPEVNDRRVLFGTPDAAVLRDEGFLCADMHFHTNASDSFTEPEDAVVLARSKGIGLAITDHNLVQNAVRLADRKDIMVIPGMEVSTTDGPHILVWFYDPQELQSFWRREIRPRLQSCPWLALRDCKVEKLLDLLEPEHCVVSAAHPMGYFGNNKGLEACIRKGYVDNSVLKRFDAYEVVCSGMTHSSNLQACESAKRHGLSYTGGSDGHILEAVGTAVTAAEAADRTQFLDAIAKNRTLVIGQEKDIVGKMLTGSASMVRFLEHAPSAIHIQAKSASYSAVRASRKAKKAVVRSVKGRKKDQS